MVDPQKGMRSRYEESHGERLRASAALSAVGAGIGVVLRLSGPGPHYAAFDRSVIFWNSLSRL